MKRVITISLNGNAFQLEEDASAALAEYLDAATRALAANPDREEILGDLEQAIADKCGRFLGPHKSVLRLAELEQVIAEMGPVEAEASGEPSAARASGRAQPGQASGATGDAAPGAGARDSAGAGGNAGGGAQAGPAPRKLYQISEGAVISGLCNGLAAWLGVDVTPVRVLAVVLAFLTGGMAALVYVVLMFIVPYASTSEERAAAHGLPFNARVLVERAKQKYSQFADSARDPAARAGWRKEWRREWRHARAEMRHAAREAGAEWRASRAAWSPAMPATPAHVAARTITGIVLAAVGVLVAVFTVAWVLGLVSLVTTGAVFGWTLPFHAPFWFLLIVMFVLFGVITAPLRLLRKSSLHGVHAGPAAAYAALEGMAGLAFVVVMLWYASHHTAEIREFFEHLRSAWQATAHSTST